MLIMIIVFIVLLFLGVPLLFSMGFSSVVYFLVTDSPQLLSMIPERFMSGMNSFIIMAIPLFTFMGLLMSKGGIMSDLLDFVNVFVGRFRGGLAYTNIFASTIFGGISGSAFADVGAMSTTLVPLMEETGYDKEFSAAVTIASSVQSPLIPPSIPALVVAGVASVSVGSMFMAGIVPGLLTAIMCATVTFVLARKRKYPTVKIEFTAKRVWSVTKQAIWALLTPLLVLGGVLSGWFTVTESGAIAVVYALVICFFVKHTDFKTFLEILKETVRSSAMTYIMLAVIQVFAWIIAYEQIPLKATAWLVSISSNPTVLTLLLLLFLLIWGMWMDVTAAIIIFGPLLFPIFTGFGMHPVHLGAILIFSLCIGIQSPPFGTLVFVVSSITKCPMGRLIKELVPFYLGEVIILLLIAFLPEITLFLPRIMGLLS